MPKQLLISVGREFGSGGHVVAQKLAEKFELPVYDYNLLRDIAIDRALDINRLEKYDEVPKNKIFSRRVRGYSSSSEENIAYMQFKYLRDKAKNGESFVVIGRCAEMVLCEYPCLISIFILADMDFKIERTADTLQISKKNAEVLVNRHNKKRKEYHNYYCTGKWGDSRNYDISINSSKLGIEKTADLLINYVIERIGNKETII